MNEDRCPFAVCHGLGGKPDYACCSQVLCCAVLPHACCVLNLTSRGIQPNMMLVGPKTEQSLLLTRRIGSGESEAKRINEKGIERIIQCKITPLPQRYPTVENETALFSSTAHPLI